MDLKSEIQHIFDSGANELRVEECTKRYTLKILKSLLECNPNDVHYVIGNKIEELMGIVRCTECNEIIIPNDVINLCTSCYVDKLTDHCSI
jgi:formylmethanofuran dehydrogenase subunit E